jgi:hypothetical protein
MINGALKSSIFFGHTRSVRQTGEHDMKYLFSLLVLVSMNAFAEEDLFAQFERTICQPDTITKEVTCSLDGKKVPVNPDKKQALSNAEGETEESVIE